MTWGPYVNCEPMRDAEELERLEEERQARKRLRRLGLLLAFAFGVAGLRNCASMGAALDREAQAIEPATVRRGG